VKRGVGEIPFLMFATNLGCCLVKSLMPFFRDAPGKTGAARTPAGLRDNSPAIHGWENVQPTG